MWGGNGRRAGRQEVGNVDTPSNTGTHVGRQSGTLGNNGSNGNRWETAEDQGRQDRLAKADTPSNTGTHMQGDNGETRPPEANTPSNTGTHVPQRETMGDKGGQGETRGDKTSGRRTHHPTPRWTPKKALKTPNSTLFGEKERVKMCQENGRPGWCRHDYPHKSPREPNYPTCSKQL